MKIFRRRDRDSIGVSSKKTRGATGEVAFSSKSFSYMFDMRVLGISESEDVKSNFLTDGVGEFENVLDTVFLLGENLKKNCSFSTFSDYKSSVRRFLSLVLVRAYKIIRVQGVVNPRTCLQREYSMIKIVNQRLDSLVKAVLKNQEEVFLILEKVEEIRGILINYMC